MNDQSNAMYMKRTGTILSILFLQESFESDVLSVMENLKEDCERVLSSMNEKELEEKHRKYLREIILVRTEREREREWN